MTRSTRLILAVTILIAMVPLCAQPSPAIRARIDSFVAAFNDTPEAFEAFAQSTFTPEALARSDAQKRRRTHEMVRKDFGRLTVRSVERISDTRLKLAVEGSTGAAGEITLGLEPAPPHRILGLALRLGGGPEGPALPPAPVTPEMSPADLAKALDAYVGKLAAEDRFSGTLLVARDGKPVFERAYGFANRADEVANTPRTRHSLGSINKHFTRTAIGQLAAAGRLSLDEPLGKHLPEHPNVEARKATIEQLLDHTAGLGDFFGPDFKKADKSSFRTNSDYYAFVAPRALTFAPGSQKKYCNACYITLGEIVTRVSGMPYERYVEKHILQPAGMTDTGFFQTDHVVPRIAIGYVLSPEGARSNLYMRGAGGSAAGSAFGTAADLLALDNALREGKLLDPRWTAWFFDEESPAEGRVQTSASYAGGSGGINAMVSSDGRWTVIAMANLSPPSAETLAEEVHRALTR